MAAWQNNVPAWRQAIVAAVLRGRSQRAVARRFGVGLGTVQRWVARASGQRLNRTCWTDRPHVPQRVARTSSTLESRIVELRATLKHDSDLGEYGAAAIARALSADGVAVPSERTIHRVLVRHGALDHRRRVRRPAPPVGWYLPACAAQEAELDSWDFVEGLVLAHGPEVETLNVISLHGGYPGASPDRPYTAVRTLDTILEHWRSVGLPVYAQFDNDTRFQGPHQHPDVLSRVMRLCLQLDVIPVFAPPREHGFQNRIESFNGRWQRKVWARFHHESLAHLQQRSARYLAAARARLAPRSDSLLPRRSVPAAFQLDLQAPPHGRLVFLRRTDDHGRITVLGHAWAIDPLWPHRLVRAEVDLDHHRIDIYRLRRREPLDQPLVQSINHRLPVRRFRE
jgi:transposase-like protein